MKKEIKCYRCGKVYDLSVKNVEEVISCGHCHQQMRINKKASRRLIILRYLIMFLICLLIVVVLNKFTDNMILPMFISLLVMMLIANYIDPFCLKIVYLIFGLEYEEYHEIKKSKKEIRKENIKKNKKKNKSLFK